MKLRIIFSLLIVFVGLSIALAVISGVFLNWSFKKSLVCSDCNVILISIDTLRADHLGIYGYRRGTSPNIDKFFKDGLVFTNHITQSLVTLPSHMSIMTSLYPQEHGEMLLTSPVLSFNFKTIAEIFKKEGFATAGFYNGSGHLDPKFGFGRGFDEYIVTGGTTPVLERLERLAKSQQKFFAFFHSGGPHDPYVVKKAYADKFVDPNYRGKIDSDPKNYQKLPFSAQSKLFWDTVDKNSKEDIRHLIDLYDAEILRSDEDLGRLFSKLKESGLVDKTIVILTADHGEEFSEHGEFKHMQLYDEVLRVPLLIRNPDIKKGVKIGALTQNIDIFPTVLNFLGMPEVAGISGKSLVPLINGEENEINKFTISQWSQLTAIRTDQWKLILSRGKSQELYNIAQDSKEDANVIGEFPNVARGLENQLLGVLKTAVQYEYKDAPGTKIDEETRKKLIKEGYF